MREIRASGSMSGDGKILQQSFCKFVCFHAAFLSPVPFFLKFAPLSRAAGSPWGGRRPRLSGGALRPLVRSFCLPLALALPDPHSPC